MLKNLPLAANVVANYMGVFMIYLVQGQVTRKLFPVVTDVTDAIGFLYDPLVVGLCIYATLRYERPIRRCLDYPDMSEAPALLLTKARKRLLYTPYFFMGMNLLAWGMAAVLFPTLLSYDGAPYIMIVRTAAQALIIGLVTCTLAFFLVEAILQTFLMPHLFPDGGVFDVQGVFRTRIATRIFALFVIAGFVPGVVSLLMASGIDNWAKVAPLEPLEIVDLFSAAMSTNAVVFMSTGLVLAMLVSLTLAYPFRAIVGALKDMSQGRLDVWVPVRSNDEVGYTCESINRMAVGLREREQLRRSLSLAGAVQKSLLPAAPPVIKGLDIAGASQPCDETGGDYFDYIEITEPEHRLGVVVGDVSGHGISSALLMTTARAMVRTRSALPGTYRDKLADINRQLCKDVGDSGNFMTLFFLGITPATRDTVWVRSGHDPAMLYNPATDTFQELTEGGPALGILPDAEYSRGRGRLEAGQIVLIGTDGIWETRREGGEFFGKERVRGILRANAQLSAQDILNALLHEVTAFRGTEPAADDVTAVVVKAAG